MSGILKRDVYAIRKDSGEKGCLVFSDWASVVTGIGQCVEPFQINARPTQTAYDDDDMMRRVDDVIMIPSGKHSEILSDEKDIRLHGGRQSPTG